MANTKPIILLAFANDEAHSLRELAHEHDELRETLRLVERDGKCQLLSLTAATPAKIIQAFHEHYGHIRIFHYGGHSDADSLFLHKDYPDQDGARAEGLAAFLATQPGLELVFLNGCLNLAQVETYHRAGARAVIATDRPIGDAAARAFARLFYQGLAGGASIDEAFQGAEGGFRAQHGELWRGIDPSRPGGDRTQRAPWRLFPDGDHPWRLPLVARYLTRVPAIDLEREFFGREEDMARLSKMLDDASRVVLVNGLGGIGKTVLATAYVQTHADRYEHIAWINRGEDLITAFALNTELADTLGLPFKKDEDLANRFRHLLWTLQQLPGRNLLVIDNAQEQVAQREVLEQLPGPPQWRVLLTSRLELTPFERMRLDMLAPADARALFLQHFHGPYTEEELGELLEEVGFHTLTVELLAKLLNKLNNNFRITQLIKTLRSKKLDNPELQEQVWTRHAGEERSIFLHLMKAFELTKLSRSEKWLLRQFIVLPVERYMAKQLAQLLNADSISLADFLHVFRMQAGGIIAKGFSPSEWLEEDWNRPLFELVASWQNQGGMNRMVVPFTKLIAKIFPTGRVLFYPVSLLKLNKIMNALAEKGWLTAHPDGSFSIHRLLRQLIEYRLKPSRNDIKRLFEVLSIRTMQNPLTNPVTDNFPWMPYASAVEQYLADKPFKRLSTFQSNMAMVYLDMGEYTRARELLEVALAYDLKHFRPDHKSVAIRQSNLASVYKELGEYAQARRLMEAALASGMKHFGPDHPTVALRQSNLANLLGNIGEYPLAIELLEAALASTIKNFGPDHPSIAIKQSNLANIFRKLGENDAALHLQEEALASAMTHFDPDHPRLAVSHNNLAHAYMNTGALESARKHFEQAVAIGRKTLGADHPSTKIYETGLRFVLLKLNRKPERHSYLRLTELVGKNSLAIPGRDNGSH